MRDGQVTAGLQNAQDSTGYYAIFILYLNDEMQFSLKT
jgi:hypothetical protein